MIENISFFSPLFLWLLLLVPIYVWFWFRNKNKQNPTLTISSLQGFGRKQSKLQRLMPVFCVLNVLAIIATVIALARPQSVTNQTRVLSTNGIDNVLAMDDSVREATQALRHNR